MTSNLYLTSKNCTGETTPETPSLENQTCVCPRDSGDHGDQRSSCADSAAPGPARKQPREGARTPTGRARWLHGRLSQRGTRLL